MVFTEEELSMITGPYAFVQWKDAAKVFCVGGDEFKQIVVYNQNGQIIAIYEYNTKRVELLEKQGIPVIDLTTAAEIPVECLTDLDKVKPMGMLWGVEE